MYAEIPFIIKWSVCKNLLSRNIRDELHSNPFVISIDPPVKLTLKLVVGSAFPGTTDFKISIDLGENYNKYPSLEMPCLVTIGNVDTDGYYYSNIFPIVMKEIKKKETCIELEDLFETWKQKNKPLMDHKINIKASGILHLGEKSIQTLIKVPYPDEEDFSIVVAEKIMNVNKSYFKEISPVFAGMIDALKEANENKLEISRFSFEIVKTVFDFFRGNEIPEDFMEANLRDLFEFADYYQIDSLKETLSNDCPLRKRTLGDISEVALKFSSESLRNRCLYYRLLLVYKTEDSEKFDEAMKETLKKLEIFNEGAVVKESNGRWMTPVFLLCLLVAPSAAPGARKMKNRARHRATCQPLKF